MPDQSHPTPYARCGLCDAPMDVPGRPWSINCGGDCAAGMAEYGDPDMRLCACMSRVVDGFEQQLREVVMSDGEKGWRTMESAPRDETDVLLFCLTKPHRPPAVAGWFEGHHVAPGWYSYD